MDHDTFDATALRSLQAETHRELLDIIDHLRAQGLNDHVDLPQLIVCGDQSSGKSSVLGAISGVPFPKKENLCTRFATEVNLRRDDTLTESQITVSIMSSTSRNPADRSTLEAFKRELKSMTDLPSIIDEASQTMGLGAANSAFSADVLRLEVRGPQIPQLTIVDLPGLIHSENKHQSEEDIKLVTKLVEDYMLQERSIVLAVVSAKNDYANQIVLTKARKVDPEGKRTLGIITKPDTLFHRSESEASYIALAKNQDVHFSLGWHVVRNLDSNESAVIDRNVQEERFFKTTEWKTLNSKQRGIHTLRDRLSLVLFQQIRQELPGLISEITATMEKTREELDRMGRSRATNAEKQMFLVELGQRFRELCGAACEGLYDDPFFGESDDRATDDNRLRAIVQNLNIDFTGKMLNATPRYAVGGSSPSHQPNQVSIRERATALIRSHRGKELPGTFNPLLIGTLFRELSRPWFEQTKDHAERLWISARRTVVEILTYITHDHVKDSCMKLVIDPQLEQMRETLISRLEEYMKEYRRQPITYNQYLMEAVQKARNKGTRAKAMERLQRIYNTYRDHPDADKIVDTLFDDKNLNMDDAAAESLMYHADAYYEVAIKRVMDEVPAHVIEPTIMIPLPKLLDPSTILNMPCETVQTIGGESEARMKHRESLRAKLDVLNRSNMICKVYSDRIGDEVAATSLGTLAVPLREESGARPAVDSLLKDDDETDAPADTITLSEPVEESIADVSETPQPSLDGDSGSWDIPAHPKTSKKKKKQHVLNSWSAIRPQYSSYRTDTSYIAEDEGREGGSRVNG